MQIGWCYKSARSGTGIDQIHSLNLDPILPDHPRPGLHRRQRPCIARCILNEQKRQRLAIRRKRHLLEDARHMCQLPALARCARPEKDLRLPRLLGLAGARRGKRQRLRIRRPYRRRVRAGRFPVWRYDLLLRRVRMRNLRQVQRHILPIPDRPRHHRSVRRDRRLQRSPQPGRLRRRQSRQARIGVGHRCPGRISGLSSYREESGRTQQRGKEDTDRRLHDQNLSCRACQNKCSPGWTSTCLLSKLCPQSTNPVYLVSRTNLNVLKTLHYFRGRGGGYLAVIH